MLLCVCTCVCVFLYLLHAEYQNTHSVGRVRTCWLVVNNFKGLLEGKDLVFKIRVGGKLGLGKGLGNVLPL